MGPRDRAGRGRVSPRPRVAAILAGGEGRRLGGLAKEAIVFQGEALGPRLARLLGESFERVIVVTRRAELYAAAGEGASGAAPPLIGVDLIPGFGPLSGLHAALSLARKRGLGEWLWLAACDMPRFDPRLLELLASRLSVAEARAESEGRDRPLAVLARYGEHFEPFQALYSTRLIEVLEELFAAAGPRLAPAKGPAPEAAAPGARQGPEEGRREARRPSFRDLFRGKEILFVEEEAVRALSPDWGLFFNINRPEDLVSVSKLVEEGGPPGREP